MAITVTMIEEKEFKTIFRGYDPVEVDEFLDAICDEMISMQNTIQSLRDQAREKGPQPYAPLPLTPAAPVLQPPPAPALPADLQAAKRLLEETQLACDRVLDEAKKRARLPEAGEGSAQAEERVASLAAERDRLEKEVASLKAEVANFRNRLQSLLQGPDLPGDAARG